MRSTKRGERGAAAVEMAFVSMLLVTMLYGIVEVSFLIRDGMVVSAASRAGARMASSLPRDTSFATSARDQVEDALASVDLSRVDKVWVFKADPSTGLPASGSFTSCSTSCLKFKGSATGLIADGGSYAATSQNACLGSQGPPDQIGVYVEYRYAPRIGLFSGKLLTENTVMRLEPVTTGACR